MKISHENGLNNMVLRNIYSHRKGKHPCTYDVLVFPVAAFQSPCIAVKQSKSLTQHLLWTWQVPRPWLLKHNAVASALLPCMSRIKVVEGLAY